MIANAPAWAAAALIGLSAVNLSLQALRGGQSAESKVSEKDSKKRAAFKAFQYNYLAVYYIITLSDWLQGTHMWTLYNEYRQQKSIPEDGISSLFLTGFATSAVCSSIIGPYIDRYGRKAAVVIYCILELIINTLEHFPNFYWLIVGRLLGGVSTALLFSAFESWMVTEHKKKGFPEELLSDTFALASTGNGLLGVLAGIMAQWLADRLGNIGPFQAAIALTALGQVIVMATWSENTAHDQDAEEEGNKGDGEKKEQSQATFSEAIGLIRSKPDILYVGLIQATFEGAMYTFGE